MVLGVLGLFAGRVVKAEHYTPRSDQATEVFNNIVDSFPSVRDALADKSIYVVDKTKQFAVDAWNGYQNKS
jgi:hypothetical protein